MIQFNKSYILENERVLLKPLSMSNMEDLLPYSLNEPDLWAHSIKPANGKDNLIQYIKCAEHDRKNETAYPFVVLDKLENKIVGSTRLYNYDKTHNTIFIGFTWYGKKYQGTGLNKNCKFLLLEFAFEQIGIERVEFRADTRNKRSINAMKSIGCIEEGILRNNCLLKGERISSIVLSIIKSDWESSVKELIISKI